MKISWKDHVTNEEVLQRAKSKRLEDIVSERRLRLAGHILRMPEDRNAKIAMGWLPSEGKRGRGQPPKTWRRTLIEDLEKRVFYVTKI